MRNIAIFVFVLYLCQNTLACCCFRDPYMLPSTPCTNMCGSSCSSSCSSSCGNTCANMANSCNCGAPCKCFRDPSNICNVCDTPSLVCQCMSKCGCDGPKCPIYFPEVEYPVTIMEINPFYYRTCFSA